MLRNLTLFVLCRANVQISYTPMYISKEYELILITVKEFAIQKCELYRQS